MESDEIVGHVPEFLPEVLPAMMESQEITSIDAVCTGKPKNAFEGA